MTLLEEYSDLYSNDTNMEHTTERQDSLEERCLAINELDQNQNKSTKKVLVENFEMSITSIDLAQSQLELQRAIAESRRHHNPQAVSCRKPKSDKRRISSDRSENSRDVCNKGVPTHDNSQISRKSRSTSVTSDSSTIGQQDVTSHHSSDSLDVYEELRLAKENIAKLENRVEKLEKERTELREANQMWAQYAAELKLEHKRAFRSASADDIRGSTMPKGVTNEINIVNNRRSHQEVLTRKSEGDIDLSCTHPRAHSDSYVLESLQSQVSLLTQQVKIYKDDFTLERRDRVRSVMEAKRLQKEVAKLKGSLTKQKQHAIKEQFLTCDDFDYLNQH